MLEQVDFEDLVLKMREDDLSAYSLRETVIIKLILEKLMVDRKLANRILEVLCDLGVVIKTLIPGTDIPVSYRIFNDP